MKRGIPKLKGVSGLPGIDMVIGGMRSAMGLGSSHSTGARKSVFPKNSPGKKSMDRSFNRFMRKHRR